MKRTKTIFLLTSLSWSTETFSQDVIRVDIQPSKIAADISMIIPAGENFVLERYHFFKYNYWLSAIDTLEQTDDGILKGDGVTINPERFTVKLDKCDTTINKIRNAALSHQLTSELRHMSRDEIGYDNKEFTKGVNRRKPTEIQEKTICHDDFKIIGEKWFEEQVDKINEIKKKKIDRLKWIESNPDKVDIDFINLFLQDYGSCPIDQAALVDLMGAKTNDFLTVCKNMNDTDFFTLKLKLTDLPEDILTDEVITKMKDSPVNTKRKGKLIRKLKENALRN